MSYLRGWTATRRPRDSRANPHHALEPMPAGACHAVADAQSTTSLCGVTVIVTAPGPWPPSMVPSSDVCSACAIAEALAVWWESLNEGDQAELLTLHEGDVLPGRFVTALTHALGAGPAGVKWEQEPGYTFHVDGRLGSFLDQERDRRG